MISQWRRTNIFRKTKRQTKEKNNEIKRGRSERRNCLRKCFHSFKYVIDHLHLRFFFLVSSPTCSHSLNDVISLHWFVSTLLYYLLHLFSSDCFASLTSVKPYTFFLWICEFLHTHPRRKVFHNVKLSNLEMFYKENQEQVGTGSVLLEYPEAQILKTYPLCANHCGVRCLYPSAQHLPIAVCSKKFYIYKYKSNLLLFTSNVLFILNFGIMLQM